MKKALLERCQNLESEFQHQCKENGTCSLGDAETNLKKLADRIEASGHGTLADDVRKNVTSLALRARLHKARAEALADHAGEEASAILKGMQQDVHNIRSDVEQAVAYDEAAVAINRRMHESTGTLKEIVKGLLMWVDTPEEVLQKERAKEKTLVS